MKQITTTIQKEQYFVFFITFFFLVILLFLINGDFNYWFKFWWMFPVSLIISLIVNTLGISGAALFVPFFILIFPLFSEPLSASQSVKLGLITESFGLSSSALAFVYFGLVDKKLATYAIVGALPFVIAGALVTSFIPSSILLLMISVLLIVSILLLKYKNILKKNRLHELSQKTIDYTEKNKKIVSIKSHDGKTYVYCRTKSGYRKRFFGYGVGGFFQGASGFGIGEMGIISMILSNIPTRIAVGTSHLVVASTAIIASIIHISFTSTPGGLIPWNIPFITVPAVIIGGQLAPYVTAKLPTKTLEKFISALFIIIAISLIILTFN
jgi:uncharacterized membrane protein YfcA